MTTKLSEKTIREQFASRAWAVHLNINGEPVNHDRPALDWLEEAWTEYHPIRGKVRDHALERFIQAVEMAALKSHLGPAVLDIHAIEHCDDEVIDWLTVLLQTGREMEWCDGMRVELAPENLIVNLRLDDDDPATAEVVERIVG